MIKEEVSFFPLCQRKILLGQKILFGFKIEFLYWCIYVFHHPLESVHQFMHYASHFFFSLFGYSMPSHFALQYFYFYFFFTISCISIRVNRDVTSPPVNHCWGWLLEMDWADIQAAPLLSLHLNRPVWCGQRGREVMSRGNGERQSVLILTHNPTHGPSVTSSSASCIWCLLGRGANWVGVSCLNWFKCIKEIRSAVCSVV